MPYWTKNLVFLLLLVVSHLTTMAQQPDLWQAVQTRNDSLAPRQFIYRHTAPLKWSWNPVKMTMRTAMFAYQRKLTYQVSSQCIYTPSCSEFGRQCFEMYGPAKALMLTLDRISRCSPAMKTSLSHYDLVEHNGTVHYHDPPSRYQYRRKR
jgi:putative component of membrane protein insertase Oxa1/YidC/SpoIIIJ protein YidD